MALVLGRTGTGCSGSRAARLRTRVQDDPRHRGRRRPLIAFPSVLVLRVKRSAPQTGSLQRAAREQVPLSTPSIRSDTKRAPSSHIDAHAIRVARPGVAFAQHPTPEVPAGATDKVRIRTSRWEMGGCDPTPRQRPCTCLFEPGFRLTSRAGATSDQTLDSPGARDGSGGHSPGP